ncbi:SGNH/GDSL hydrolase family protein [Cohaesibacter celericrescens]|uniref:DUF459 domain-containing protein n=1 Tax=Cohaesibacter celericrescens TaxID=2067669 RepID=A0A2N5XWY5_9HYPH|nr:DUF459 domain-containing protein [Cohaesibacter celericrescens]PLW79021.1 hypothetical protein C0081_01960 [Cohaesibacter celericrescens]
MSAIGRYWKRHVCKSLVAVCLSAVCVLHPTMTLSAMAASVSTSQGLVPVRAAPRVTPDDGRYEVALGFFERLFKRRTKKVPEASKEKKSSSGQKAVVKAPTKPVIKTVTKDDDAAVIAIFGDEFSQDIGWGLKDAFSQTPDVKIDIHSVPKTGLVYRASRNPLKNPSEVYEKSPFSFAVVLVGLNDRVRMSAQKNADGVEIFPAYDFKSEGWGRSYVREIDRLRSAFSEIDRPIYWVGLPPVANKKLSADMRHLNDFVSSRLTGRGERFINIWDAFSNEEGEFTYRGPNLAGQEKRLRQKNGIRFNKEGRRKLAFFVEKLVIRVLSQSVDEDVLPENLASADETALREGRGASRDIFVLRKPPLDADQLVDPASFSASLSDEKNGSGRARTVGRAPELRVDNFSWVNP